MHKGHYGQYTGNAKWSRDHAHTKVTKENYDATKKDDEAHMHYLKDDVLYDAHHGGSCLLYTSPSPRDVEESRMPSSA